MTIGFEIIFTIFERLDLFYLFIYLLWYYIGMSLALSFLGHSSISSSSFLGCSNDGGISINSMKSSLIPLDCLGLSKSPKGLKNHERA